MVNASRYIDVPQGGKAPSNHCMRRYLVLTMRTGTSKGRDRKSPARFQKDLSGLRHLEPCSRLKIPPILILRHRHASFSPNKTDYRPKRRPCHSQQKTVPDCLQNRNTLPQGQGRPVPSNVGYMPVLLFVAQRGRCDECGPLHPRAYLNAGRLQQSRRSKAVGR